MSGKGSKQRPFGVPKEKFDSNWDNIFKNKKPTEAEQQEQAWLKDEFYDLEKRKEK